MADADILKVWNQALQLIGTKSTVGALAEDSNEATNCVLVYATIRDWALTLTNWNFARKTAVLALQRTVSPAVAPWSTTYPAPPWVSGYTYPTDCLKAQYVTDMSLEGTKFAGRPARFAVAWDTLSAARTILTDKSSAVLTYTYQVVDPSLWPSYFARTVSAHLAVAICPALSGNLEVMKACVAASELFTTLAVEANLREGLYIEDTTPEWIIARGIPYPNRRAIQERPAPAQGGSTDGNQR